METESGQPITLAMMRDVFYSAVVCDALDSAGYPRQSPRVPWRPLTTQGVLIGRAKTTLWAEMAHPDPQPYELELQAVDSCRPDDVFIAAAAGSMRSGLWGELLSTAARRGGCVGALVDGAVRDVEKMRRMQFPIWARGTCIYDSRDRNRVIDVDVPVEIDGVRIAPGDLVVADVDGVVAFPASSAPSVLAAAESRFEDEERLMQRLEQGSTTVELLGLEEAGT